MSKVRERDSSLKALNLAPNLTSGGQSEDASPSDSKSQQMSEQTRDQRSASAASEDGDSGADPGKPAGASVEESLAEGDLELGFFSRGMSDDHLRAASEHQSELDMFFDPGRARRRLVVVGFCGLLVAGLVGMGVRNAFTERSLRPEVEATPALATAQPAAVAPAPAAMPAELVPPVGALQRVVSVDQLRARVQEGPMPEGPVATVGAPGEAAGVDPAAHPPSAEGGNGNGTPAAAPAAAATPATTAPVPAPAPPAAVGAPAPAPPAGAGTSAAPAVVDPGAGLWAASAPRARTGTAAAPAPAAPQPAATAAALPPPTSSDPAVDKKREAAPAGQGADGPAKVTAKIEGAAEGALEKAPAPATGSAPAAGATPAKANASDASSAKLSACTGVLRSGRFKERYREVDSKCRAAFQAAPAAPLAMEIAQAALENGRNADAASWARRAIGVDPRHANAFVLLGGAEQQMGHPAEARAAYARYLELAPNGEHAQDVRALLPRLAGM
jgi:hypothetical protein